MHALPSPVAGAFYEAENISGPVASNLAVRAAARMLDESRERTVRRLYAFNTAPWSRADERLLSGVVGRDLLIRQAGLERHPRNSPGYRFSQQRQGWLYWRHPEPCAVSSLQGTRKVYCTPKPTAMARFLRVLVEIGLDVRVPVFKFPADYPGLRRPDRIVLYVRDRSHAQQVTDELVARSPRDCPTDPLPFTEQLADGIFTGLDPAPASARGGSWRQLVCRRLADSLHAAAGHPPEVMARRAEDELRDWGVDPGDFRVPDTFFEGETRR